jgi:hypothetical protein
MGFISSFFERLNDRWKRPPEEDAPKDQGPSPEPIYEGDPREPKHIDLRRPPEPEPEPEPPRRPDAATIQPLPEDEAALAVPPAELPQGAEPEPPRRPGAEPRPEAADEQPEDSTQQMEELRELLMANQKIAQDNTRLLEELAETNEDRTEKLQQIHKAIDTVAQMVRDLELVTS